MRFDQWLLKHINKPYALGFIAYDFKVSPYNPLFKYKYCDLFVRCYHHARYEYDRAKSNLTFCDWILAYIDKEGKIGNLARDTIDCMVCIDEKFKYCKKYVRHFETCIYSYYRERGVMLEDLNIPINLDLKIEGVRRVSIHLMEHPCFQGFDKFLDEDLGTKW